MKLQRDLVWAKYIHQQKPKAVAAAAAAVVQYEGYNKILEDITSLFHGAQILTQYHCV